MNKKIIAVVGLYLIQFLGSGCCSCADPVTYERIYTDVIVTAYDTSGFQNTEIIGDAEVYRNAFGITVLVASDINAIGFRRPEKTNLNFGFTTALACSCPDDVYVNEASISKIEITVLDVATGVTTLVTQNFITQDYSGKPISLDKFITELEPWHDGFSLDLEVADTIPEKAVFTVAVTLDSGVSFENSTSVLTFV